MVFIAARVPLRIIALIGISTGLLFFYTTVYGQTNVVAAGEISASAKMDPSIDRVIPSKPNDLFVVLKNGLTVLIRESHGSEVVSCQIHVKTGSIFEGDRMGGGLSHYLEHVVSGGTTSRYSESEIGERVQALGGASNAYTSYGETTYFINTTGAFYREALDLVWAYVTDCRFEEQEYEREKKVIIQELQMGENDPSRQLWYSFMQTAYRTHPVRYPVIGEKDVYLSMDRDDLMAHYHRWYTPEHMVVSVAGDIRKESVLQTLLEMGCGAIARAKNPPYVLPQEPAQLAAREVKKVMPVAKLAQAMLGFRTASLTHPDLYPLDVLAVILGDGRTSRLYQKVRDERRLVLSVDTWSWTPYFADGQFVISMDLPEDKLSEAVAAVWEELEAIKSGSVSESDLRRAKNKVISDHVFGLESAEDQAAHMASNWISTGDPYFSDYYVQKIQTVDVNDLVTVARKYFLKEAMTLAVVQPEEETAESGKADHSKNAVGIVEKRVLPNQLTLLTKKNSSAPIVTLQLVVRGGVRFEPEDKSGLCHFMANLLTKGTTTRTKLDIATALEDVGGSIGSSSGNNTVAVSVSVLKEYADLALDILADVVLHPIFPEEEIEKQRQDTLLAIKRLDEDWTTEITRMFKSRYYHTHPYRKDVLGDTETVQAFTRKDVQKFYELFVKPDNAVLAVFGDVDPDGVEAKVQKAFAGFKPGVVHAPVIALETDNILENKTVVVENEKTSAAIFVGFNGLTIHDPDVPAVDVMDAIVSGIGYPSGWLHVALRGGEQSLVYFIHAFPAFGIDGGHFGVMTQTTEENFDDVLRIILDKIDLIKKREVDQETLDRAKQMCITMHRLGLERIESQASSAALNEILGLGYERDETYPSLIQNISAADVLRVAKRLFSNHLVVATKPSRGQQP